MRQELFNHMAFTHKITLLDSEMDDIERVVLKEWKPRSRNLIIKLLWQIIKHYEWL